MQTENQKALSIEQNAAHLLAALLSKDSGLDVNKLSIDAREDIQVLRDQLNAGRHLDAYKRGGGRLDIW